MTFFGIIDQIMGELQRKREKNDNNSLTNPKNWDTMDQRSIITLSIP